MRSVEFDWKELDKRVRRIEVPVMLDGLPMEVTCDEIAAHMVGGDPDDALVSVLFERLEEQALK
jgi:hypothetical protein